MLIALVASMLIALVASMLCALLMWRAVAVCLLLLVVLRVVAVEGSACLLGLRSEPVEGAAACWALGYMFQLPEQARAPA